MYLNAAYLPTLCSVKPLNFLSPNNFSPTLKLISLSMLVIVIGDIEIHNVPLPCVIARAHM